MDGSNWAINMLGHKTFTSNISLLLCALISPNLSICHTAAQFIKQENSE